MKTFSDPNEAAGAPVKCVKDASGAVTELTIERSRWARMNPELTRSEMGLQKYTQPNGASLLLSGVGGMCCLGFYSRACGLTPTYIWRKPSPNSLGHLPKQMRWLLMPKPGTGSIADELMSTNDLTGYATDFATDGTTPKLQEKAIQKVFAKHGIKITFV